MHKLTSALLVMIIVLLAVVPVLAQGGLTLSGSVIFGTAILRESPALEAPEVGQATQTDALAFVGRTEDGTWYQLELADGQLAWVPDYVVQVEGNAADLPVVAVAVPEPVVEAPPSDVVYLPPGCDYFNIGPFFATSEQRIVITQGWAAASLDLLEAYRNNVVQIVAFDGRLLSTYNASAGEPFFDEATGTFRVFWSYDLGRVAIGEHRTEWTQMFNAELTDGLDSNGDGLPDAYGPNPVTDTCTLIVE